MEQLRALKSVVDHGTFEAAARALHVTPSAVSQRIKTLESSVGRVLVRRTKPVTPTESGVAVLRLARQVDTLTGDILRELQETSVRTPVSLAVNADSLATWVLPALAPLAGAIVLDLHRDDQEYTAELLRDGTVTAAITSDPTPVRGCTATRLGSMRYRPVASSEFVAHRLTASRLAGAPVVVFDAKDALQDRYLVHRGVDPSAPPRHLVPSSAEYVEAVRLGFGWGMLPDQQRTDPHLVVLDEYVHDVTLYWQQWTLSSAALDRVAEAVRVAAGRALRQD